MRIVSPFEPFHTLPYFCSGHQGQPRSVTLTFSRANAEGLPPGVDAIVATADLQGRTEPGGRLIGELVAEELGILAGLGVIPEPGLILLAGDFFDDPACAKRGRSGEVGPVWRAFADRFPTVAGVHGNHDVLTAVPPGATVLDGRQETIAGIRLAGICGIMGCQTRPQRRSPESYCTSTSICWTTAPKSSSATAAPTSLHAVASATPPSGKSCNERAKHWRFSVTATGPNLSRRSERTRH